MSEELEEKIEDLEIENASISLELIKLEIKYRNKVAELEAELKKIGRKQ